MVKNYYSDYDLANEALSHLSPSCDRDSWIRIGQAIHSQWPGESGFRIWDRWSSGANDKYSEKACRIAWKSFKQPPPKNTNYPDGYVRLGTLFAMAAGNGWSNPGGNKPVKKNVPSKIKFTQSNDNIKTWPPAKELQNVLNNCVPIIEDEIASDWCKSRGMDVAKIDEQMLAGVLPVKYLRNVPKWFPSLPLHGRKRIAGRLLLPLFDFEGRLRSVTGRVIDFNEVGDTSNYKAKASRPIRPYGKHPGFKAAGLCMMNRLARDLVKNMDKDNGNTTDVIIVEGEPDFLIRCQTAPEAAVFGIYSGSIKKELADRIPHGTRIYIEVDRDDGGDNYTRRIVSLFSKHCRLFKLKNNLPEGDINELYLAGRLEKPSKMCEPYLIQPKDRPKVELCCQWQLSYTLKKVWESLSERNKIILDCGVVESNNEPLFLTPSDAALCRLVWRENADKNRQLEIERMKPTQVMGILTREFIWYSITSSGVRQNRDPKRSVAELVHGDASNAPERLPVIHTISRTPVYGSDFKLIQKRGYNNNEHLWYEPGNALHGLEEIPEIPTDFEVDRARTILTECFCDFPFAGQAERATAYAAVFLPFVRRLVNSPTPIVLIEAPVQGSGKSLLARIISIIATGSAVSPIVLNHNEEESQKALAAELARGRPVVIIDNMDTSDKPLKSPALSSIATETVFANRKLGVSEMMDLPNNALWIMTGNNVKLSADLIRRFIRCRLDPGDERPWLRPSSIFRHPDIVRWTYENRKTIVWALLVLCQKWISKGCTKSKKTLGSYECYSEVIGGILAEAGISGFLDNAETFYGFADGETDAWLPFVRLWWQKYSECFVSAKKLNALCDDDGLMVSLRGDGSSLSQMQRLGRALQTNHERIVDGFKVCARKNTNTKNWEYYLESLSGQLALTPSLVTVKNASELGFVDSSYN